jgi:hypothetical protein
MKKIKVMFTAIAVVAIVSGALAFKAHHFGTGNRYCKSTSGTCPTSKDYNANDQSTTLMYCSTVSGGSCTTQIGVDAVSQ